MTSRILLAVLASLAAVACDPGPPSDAVMVAHFRTQREAFETLVRMMAEDGVVGPVDSADLSGAGAAERKARYRALVRATGCWPIVRDATGRVTFNQPYRASGGGVAGNGFKEFVYSPRPPSPIRPTLDEGPLKRFEDTFRHIGGPSYLCRMRV